MSLNDGLVEFWTLNDTKVGAVNGNVLTHTGATRYVAGKLGNGWKFRSAVPLFSSILRLSDATPLINSTGNYTLACWVWMNPNENNSYLNLQQSWMDNETEEEQRRTVFLVQNNNAIECHLLNLEGLLSVFADSPVTASSWHHLVVTSDVSGQNTTLRLFIDGNMAGETTGPVVLSFPEPFDLREFVVAFGSAGIASTRIMDCVGVWSKALSVSQIAELYNAGAGVEYPFPVPDNTPDAFALTAVSDADPATIYVSDSAEITGMDAGTAVSITGGEYRLNGGEWTAAAGTIDPSDTLELRQTSSADPETKTTATITVGTVSVEWDVTTKVGRTLKQHFLVGPDGIAQSVGACVIVPGWV